MFEHFGVRDVFTALWKYVTILIVLLVAAELACVGFHYMKAGSGGRINGEGRGLSGVFLLVGVQYRAHRRQLPL